jgi:hypothetical protein
MTCTVLPTAIPHPYGFTNQMLKQIQHDDIVCLLHSISPYLNNHTTATTVNKITTIPIPNAQPI